MREFFRGWKRKLGVATLVMACVFTAAWIHAESRMPSIDLPLPFGTRFRADKDGDWIQFDFQISNRSGRPYRLRHWPMSIYLSLYSTQLSAYLLLSRPWASAKKKPAE